jgi:uncharacterized coiled-coil protein SlyX
MHAKGKDTQVGPRAIASGRQAMMTDDIQISHYQRDSDRIKKLMVKNAYQSELIEELEKQIITLKEMCIQERDRYLVDFIHEYDDVRNCKKEAKKQLAKEYPRIEWEEKK